MITTLAVFGIGGWEMVLILAVVLVLFGAKRLPELAKGLGQGIKEFKKATRDVTDELQRTIEEEPYQPPRREIEYTQDHKDQKDPLHADPLHPAVHAEATVAKTETAATVPHTPPEHNKV